MLSQYNVEKLNMRGLYSAIPDSKYRGKLFERDLYHCCNWTFKPAINANGEYFMVDSYWGGGDSLHIKLTDQNFNEFSFIFDFDRVRQIKDSEAVNYENAKRVAVDSGGIRYAKYFIDKDEARSKNLVLQRLVSEIDHHERILSSLYRRKEQVENDEIPLEWA